MADCSKTVEFYAEWHRMHDAFKEQCAECPLYWKDLDWNCNDVTKANPEQAVAIVQKWSDEHPAPKPKTYADVFFERFPNAPRTKHGTPCCCWSHVYADGYCDYDAEYSEIHACRECWNEPYKESEE